MTTSQEREQQLEVLLMAQAASLKATIEAIRVELGDEASVGGGRGPSVPPRYEPALEVARAVSGKVDELIRALKGPTANGGGRGANPRPA